jgi:hypothetical protein
MLNHSCYCDHFGSFGAIDSSATTEFGFTRQNSTIVRADSPVARQHDALLASNVRRAGRCIGSIGAKEDTPFVNFLDFCTNGH